MANIRITWLGTSAGLPTAERGVSSVVMQVGKAVYLFDCGDGTLRAIMQQGISLRAIQAIFISHRHGDHCYGLPALYSTMMLERVNFPPLYAPEPVINFVDTTLKLTSGKYQSADLISIVYPHSSVPVEIYQQHHVKIISALLQHGQPANGFRVEVTEVKQPKARVDKLQAIGIKPGPIYGQLIAGKTVHWQGEKLTPEDYTCPASLHKRVFVYLTDTMYCTASVALAMDADVISHEATHLSTDSGKAMAQAQSHATLGDAVRVYQESHARKLVATHFSKRWHLADYQAEINNENIVLAYDGFSVQL